MYKLLPEPSETTTSSVRLHLTAKNKRSHQTVGLMLLLRQNYQAANAFALRVPKLKNGVNFIEREINNNNNY